MSALPEEELLDADGRPARIHRVSYERSVVNGQRPGARPVPCESCGAPVYLVEMVNLCEPGRVRRKVCEIDPVLYQYVRHRCGEIARGRDLPRCEGCEDVLEGFVQVKLQAALDALEEAERYRLHSREQLERVRELLEEIPRKA